MCNVLRAGPARGLVATADLGLCDLTAWTLLSRGLSLETRAGAPVSWPRRPGLSPARCCHRHPVLPPRGLCSSRCCLEYPLLCLQGVLAVRPWLPTFPQLLALLSLERVSVFLSRYLSVSLLMCKLWARGFRLSPVLRICSVLCAPHGRHCRVQIANREGQELGTACSGALSALPPQGPAAPQTPRTTCHSSQPALWAPLQGLPSSGFIVIIFVLCFYAELLSL